MSLFFARTARTATPAADRRSAPAMPWSSYLQTVFGAGESYADVTVSSTESALQSVAVHTSVDLLASLTSELPVHVYRGSGSDRQQLTTPGYLLDPAGDGHGLADWAYQVLLSWLMRGDVFGDILATGPGGIPTQVLLHHPDTVTGRLDGAGAVQWLVAGKPVADPAKFLHRRVNPIPGRVTGASPIEFHANQIGLQLTIVKYGLQWFRDGAHPGGILASEERNLNADQARTAKDRFLAALRGTREPAVLDRGWKYQQIQVTPEESQFLATQGYSAAECARIFGPGLAEVLGYDTGGSLTYNNPEQRMAQLLVLSLNKWLRRFERLLGEMLPRPQYAVIDRDALLQSTTLDRYKAHESALRSQWKTVNEVRADEDLAPVGWGDEPTAITAAPAPPATPAEDGN